MLHCNFGMKGFFILVDCVLSRMLGSLGGAQGGLYGLVTEGAVGRVGRLLNSCELVLTD